MLKNADRCSFLAAPPHAMIRCALSKGHRNKRCLPDRNECGCRLCRYVRKPRPASEEGR